MVSNERLAIRAGLVACITCCLTLGTIVSIGHYVDAEPKQCEDRVTALSVSNTCPHGTFMELRIEDGERYIICHCDEDDVPQSRLPSHAQEGDEPNLQNPLVPRAPVSVEL